MKAVDMHCDTIPEIWYSRCAGNPQELYSSRLAIDIEKMKKGDILLQNFAMFIDIDRKDRMEDSLELLLLLIDVFYEEMEKNKEHIGVVKSFADIEENMKQGKLSAMLTMEEAEPCRGSVTILRNLYRLGVRMMTLTWNHENSIGFPNIGGPFPGVANTVLGLKEKGIDIVEEAEKLGIILDVSHLSDAGFYDVYNHTTKPFVASHSNARAISPNVRNLTDDMIKKLSERGGVVGINFCGYFLKGEINPDRYYPSRIEDMITHIKHISNVGGIDCIGIGSDFDGIEGDLEMDNCSKLPLLEAGLRKAGFHESEIEKIFYKNVLRVYKDVLK